MPVIVLAVVDNAILPHGGAPEFLDLAQWLTRLVSGE
jgi:hypothetical protein